MRGDVRRSAVGEMAKSCCTKAKKSARLGESPPNTERHACRRLTSDGVKGKFYPKRYASYFISFGWSLGDVASASMVECCRFVEKKSDLRL